MIADVLALIAYKNYEFVLEKDDTRDILVVQAETKCNVTGEVSIHRGRKWLLSPHMTKSEIVQTAFKAALTFEEHEAREQFLFAGAAVFAPHFDVDELWHLSNAWKFDLRTARENEKQS